MSNKNIDILESYLFEQDSNTTKLVKEKLNKYNNPMGTPLSYNKNFKFNTNFKNEVKDKNYKKDNKDNRSIKDHNFVELISEYNSEYGDSLTIPNKIISLVDFKANGAVYLSIKYDSYTDNNNKDVYEYILTLFDRRYIYFDKEEDCLFMYNKLKEMLIGKGNTYIQINKTEVKSLTIPTSKKKKAEVNNDNR